HITPPKYRCPRCSTRTCSLPCTRRHKLWSQCSGIRDPAAYLRRSELATEAAFDRDFNFITGIERRLERAERDAENRGVDVSAGAGYGDLSVVGLEHEQDQLGGGGDALKGKRKRGALDMVKGEVAFLKRAETAGVRVIKAPRGMSRNKVNSSKWHARNKCLNWTVEWIAEGGGKRTRNYAETCTIAEAYDRAFPLPKQPVEKDDSIPQVQAPVAAPAQATAESPEIKESGQPGNPETTDSQTTPMPTDHQVPADNPPSEKVTPHRNVYFYLHRPRTPTKKPVLIPLAPGMTIATALRDRVVLEFPTIYVLQDLLATAQKESSFMLEQEYLHTHNNPESEMEDATRPDAGSRPLSSTVDIGDVDEGKVLEVLKKDL
ncbi:hypothetical protein P175DRAFT_0416591, partial [Aspergillus ochraceoroseus IBT 24754]